MNQTTVGAEKGVLRLAPSDIEHILPHRGRWLLINQGVHVDTQQRIAKTTRVVTLEDCDGHFPGYPVFPGVLYLEVIAQLLGVLAGAIYRTQGLGFFASFHGVSFRSKTHPGDQFMVGAALDNNSATRILGHGGVYRDDDSPVALVEKALLLCQPEPAHDPRPSLR